MPGPPGPPGADVDPLPVRPLLANTIIIVCKFTFPAFVCVCIRRAYLEKKDNQDLLYVTTISYMCEHSYLVKQLISNLCLPITELEYNYLKF